MRARAEPWKAGAVGPQPRHLLSGLARCGESGGPIAAVAAKSPPATRACSRRRFKRDLPGLAWSERSRPSWSYAKGLDSPVKALVANGAEILAGDDWGKLVQSLDEGRTFAEWELPSTPYGPKQAIAVWKDRRLVVRGAILFPPMREAAVCRYAARAGAFIAPPRTPTALRRNVAAPPAQGSAPRSGNGSTGPHGSRAARTPAGSCGVSGLRCPR
jgi:hypothetical protein